MKLLAHCIVGVSLGLQAARGESIDVRSPDGDLVASFQLVEGSPIWQLTFDGKLYLELGRLGLRVGPNDLTKLEAVAADSSSHRETVKTVWGKFAEYDDHHNRLLWTLRETGGNRRALRIEVRVYNQGVALRYQFPSDGGWGRAIQLTDDRTEFRFAENHTGWSYAGEHDPLGPQPLSRFRTGARLPLTVRDTSGVHLAVLEAAVLDHAPYQLTPSDSGKHAFRATFPASTLSGGGATSWRVVLVGRTAGELLVSPVMYCLNPPCRIENPTWVKPGLAMWDWRAWVKTKSPSKNRLRRRGQAHFAPKTPQNEPVPDGFGIGSKDGFTYGLDMPSWRRFIDFASKHHVRYLVLDAGWYGLEFDKRSDPRTSRDYLLVQPDPQNPRLVPRPAPADWDDPIDVPALIRYGRSKDVGIFLYFNDIARQNYPFEETLALYHKWGAAGIKYGFMKGGGQQKVRETRKIVELCAKYQLLCDFHDGPVPPSGDRRTYPNYVTREFCHSQSDARRAFNPTGFCEQVFVNMLAGPLDMCNGLYTLKDPARDRPKIFTNVNTTIVAETARVMITFSGLSILPDCPEAYEARSDLFDFLSKLPMTWDETRILHGEIGQYIATARRREGQWFIASATNEEARTLQLSLDFLEPDQVYAAKVYEDAPDAHYIENREAYRVRQLEVRRGDTIDVSMAPGGGHCVHLAPNETPTVLTQR